MSSNKYSDIVIKAEKIAKSSVGKFDTDLYNSFKGFNENIKIFSFSFNEKKDGLVELLYAMHTFNMDSSNKDKILSFLPKVDGFTYLKEGVYHVCLNLDIDDSDGRFTVAHEIGHIALGHVDKDYVAYFKSEIQKNTLLEEEADIFALCMLMPKRKVDSYIVGEGSEYLMLDEFCSAFKVSAVNAKKRLKMLGYINGF